MSHSRLPGKDDYLAIVWNGVTTANNHDKWVTIASLSDTNDIVNRSRILGTSDATSNI